MQIGYTKQLFVRSIGLDLSNPDIRVVELRSKEGSQFGMYTVYVPYLACREWALGDPVDVTITPALPPQDSHELKDGEVPAGAPDDIDIPAAPWVGWVEGE